MSSAAARERPPVIVISHGGPTANTGTDFAPTAQFFATRGFAVVDVDYGGSTGYGREYRRRLDGQWGVVDLEDCTNVARWLADQGLVDGARMAIRGGSAGGYTTLCALCFGDTFAAGASYFGVGDLEGLARDTHKFESRYLDRMVAPYPERVDVYRERSPIHFVDRIRCPVLVLQGTDDKVVPQAQADELVAALERKGLPYSYLLFEGEGHGFRKAENMRRALESELSFYAQIFGFEPAGDIRQVLIENLEAWKASSRREWWQPPDRAPGARPTLASVRKHQPRQRCSGHVWPDAVTIRGRGGAAAARRAHNPKVGGSNPSPATKPNTDRRRPRGPASRGRALPPPWRPSRRQGGASGSPAAGCDGFPREAWWTRLDERAHDHAGFAVCFPTWPDAVR